MLRIMKLQLLVLLVSTFAITNCGAPGSQKSQNSDSTGSYATSSSKNMRILLTDAPLDAKSVNVNIDHVELWVRNAQGGRGKISFAQDLGLVNLLDLRNGKTLPLHDVQIPEGIILDKIRIILKDSGHFVQKNDDSICELKTPSAQKTGIKIIIKNDVTIENGYDYSLLVDFDAEKSVVQKGNGGCNLKPVLKIKSLTRIVSDDNDGDDSTDGTNGDDSGDSNGGGSGDGSGGEEDLNDDDNGNDSDNSDGGDGFDDTPDDDVPPDVGDDWEMSQ